MDHNLFSICLSMDFLDCFQFAVVTNKATLNICVQVLVWTNVFVSLG